MAQDVDTGTDKQTMKIWLKTSSMDRRVNCTVGQGDDATMGLLILDRHKAGPALVKVLKQQFDDAKNIRHGTIWADAENPKLVVLSLNNKLSGMAKKLVKTLKGTGFNKVRVLFEDGTQPDNASEEDEQQPAVPGQPQASPSAAAAPPGASAAGSADAEPAAAPPQATPSAAAPEPAIYAKAQQDWNASRQSFDTDLDKLQSAFSSAFKGHEMEGDLQAAFRKRLDDVLGQFKPDLANVLNAVSRATDPAQRAALAGEAQKVLLRYKTIVAKDPTLIEIDGNPFVPLSIRKNLGGKLVELSKQLA